MNNKRRIKIPINYFKPLEELDSSKHIKEINFYTDYIDKKEYIIDIIVTEDNSYYIKLTDISDGKYNEIDFNEFKKKYIQPTLFDDFFDI